jgi:hypothetical protein
MANEAHFRGWLMARAVCIRGSVARHRTIYDLGFIGFTIWAEGIGSREQGGERFWEKGMKDET